MKQRPVFILLTFFLALISVVMITFVFLRTQLNEDKLQNIVEKTIYDNFEDFKVNIDQIGLSLGTKFRYKIGSIKIAYRRDDGVFSDVELKNVSIKFPLFFLLGKQDIDISIEEMIFKGFDYTNWINKNYKITSLSPKKLTLPRFLKDNRINLTLDNLIFNNSISPWPSPIKFKSIKHLVVKNISFSEKSAIEFDTVASTPLAENEMLDTVLFAIGDIHLGQFISNSPPDAKILFEVKSVNMSEFYWLSGHRIQFHEDSLSKKNIVSVHGNSAEGKLEVAVNPSAVNFRELQIDFKIDDLIRDNSALKNTFFILTSSLNFPQSGNAKLMLRGSLTHLLEGESRWISHLSSSVENNSDKIQVDVESMKGEYFYEFKSGNDLSYRKINVNCRSLLCKGQYLNILEMTFYNQILSDTQFLSLQELLFKASSWWSNISSLLAADQITPLKIYWKKSRWKDFEFDLYADVFMNRKSFATENIKMKRSGIDLLESKLSFSLDENKGVISRLVSSLKGFPSSVLSNLVHESKLELSGSATGILALELSSLENKYSADLKFSDGNISWLNFDDLYRRKLYFKPDDEIKFPHLNWIGQFKKSEFKLQWTDKSKIVTWNLTSPLSFKKNVKLDFGSFNNDIQVEVNFPGISMKDKRYLQANHHDTFFSFLLNRLPTELKLVDSQSSTFEESN